MMTSQVLRTLEAKGLVTREAHPTDARARALAATATGVELVNRAIGAVETVDRDFFAALGRRRGDFTKLLGKLL
jgi:DNA-binding MarR family transcriptional regulator